MWILHFIDKDLDQFAKLKIILIEKFKRHLTINIIIWDFGFALFKFKSLLYIIFYALYWPVCLAVSLQQWVVDGKGYKDKSTNVWVSAASAKNFLSWWAPWHRCMSSSKLMKASHLIQKNSLISKTIFVLVLSSIWLLSCKKHLHHIFEICIWEDKSASK